MLTDSELTTTLHQLLTHTCPDSENGRCRTVSPKRRGEPLSGIGSFITGGRFNQQNEFQVLYIADSEPTARLEFRNLFKDPQGNLIENPHRPCIPFTIIYQLESILDLTDLEIQRDLETNWQELTGIWNWLNLIDTDDIAPTQRLGKIAFLSSEIEALKIPSAVNPGAYNLAIFPDRLRQKVSYVRAIDPLGIVAQIP